MYRIYLTVFLFFSCWNLSGQNDTLASGCFSQYGTVEQRFSICLDSLDNNIYKDIELSDKIVESCLSMLKQNDPISDSLKMNFTIQRIYLEYNKVSPLEAFKIISEAALDLSEMNVSNEQIASFNYLKSFTDMTLGDLEAAQISFYNEIERGKSIGDNETVSKNLYSLGLLLKDEQNYEASIGAFKESLEYGKKIPGKSRTAVLTNIVLSDAYINLDNATKAFEHLLIAEQLIDEYKLDVLRSDLIYMKGAVYLSQNDIPNAELIYEELLELSKNSKDPNLTYNRKLFQSEIFVATKDYKRALEVYDYILADTDTARHNIRLESYKNSHIANAELGNYKAAYKNILEYNDIKKIIEDDRKRQQTDYLRVKYNAEQMSKDNELLSLEVNEGEFERKLLISGVLVLFVMLGLIYQLLRQKKNYNQLLEQKVAERTVQLRESNNSLMETNEELERFVFIASHDLKTPLNNIVSFTSLLEKRLNLLGDDESNKYISIIKEGGKRLSNLIKDTLEYSKQSKQDDQFERINLNGIINEVEDSISSYIKTRNARIITDNALPEIIAQRSSLMVLFQNLIENGLRYNTSEEPTIKIYHQKMEDHYSIFLEDNGIGIAKRYHEKIFTMFTRLHNHQDYEGSGMGLSICKKIMNKIDGDIKLTSTVDKGSLFELRFPISSI